MADQVTRRLVAIMFTDIVGYTALMERDEMSALGARDRHRTILKTLVGALFRPGFAEFGRQLTERLENEGQETRKRAYHQAADSTD